MNNFNKILIANRGEIARRIIKTCKNSGIPTVAVYSDADIEAPFVKEADESVYIGASQAQKSYLNIEKVINAAKEVNADAIHPGYGFLSENSEFALKCKENSIKFIGPDPDVIRRMGSKIESRKEMEKAGVPVVPGWNEKLTSLEEALEVANNLGYPLMLKASAGGGGMGMHLLNDSDDLKKLYELTIQRSSSFFGDGSVYLEKYINEPRHIEVQVVGDEYGNVIHLYERECSIQRRNQKVIEESPAQFLSKSTREKIFKAAITGAKHIGYSNVGTMEFILDNDENFYFLEMNTRLQVEHPVTEMVTGIDLVELQIKIASGEKLSISQQDVVQKGHAIEARLYAEDPETFYPSPGKITKLNLPDEIVRLDFAVEEGNTVTPYYDAMIGKIISYGVDRNDAIDKLYSALSTLSIEGVKTNQPLLKNILIENEFKTGRYTTKFLDNLLTLSRS